MTEFTDYMEKNVIAWVGDETQMPTPPSSVYVALHTDTPGDSPDGSTELSAGGYARQEIVPAELTGSGGTRSNDVAVAFGPATEDWPQVTHATVWDGPDDTDNPLFHGQLSQAKDIEIDQELRLKTGEIVLGVR